MAAPKIDNLTIFKTILTVGAVRYLALSLTEIFLGNQEQVQMISVFHYPANAVCIVALLVAGYWAALGIALGSTLWNIVHTSLSLSSEIELFLASVGSCFMSLLIFRSIIKPDRNRIWESPSLLEFFFFTLIFSLLIVAAAQIVFIRIPEIDALSLPLLAKMFLGNFIAVIGVYLLLNLSMTAYITVMKIVNKE